MRDRLLTRTSRSQMVSRKDAKKTLCGFAPLRENSLRAVPEFHWLAET